MKILITGGAGFVGSQLAFAFQESSEGHKITALDNLKRRGSELNVKAFKQRGIEFVHGDVRQKADFDALPDRYDLFIDASAEPSVLAGATGSPEYLLETNLGGTLKALEFARQRAGLFVFLSTSRVYSISALRALRLTEAPTRWDLDPTQELPGVSAQGIGFSFPTDSPRSLYGTSKLASELLVQEYSHAYRLPAVINRCGVIAGPGQFGKVDQGVFTLWVARHWFRHPLAYTGFGGKGKQVRDLIHPRDLYDLIGRQCVQPQRLNGNVFNVGGGPANAISLAELTERCRKLTGNVVPITPMDDTHALDIPWYVTDASEAARTFGWKPAMDLNRIFDEIIAWIKNNETELRPLFSGER
jgi:CDP-paratose 2-epimerase